MRALPIAFLSAGFLCLAQETRIRPEQVPENPPAEGGRKPRQEENKNPAKPQKQQRWNLYWQATSIGQYHGSFRSPYEGENSLNNIVERSVSLTTTFYLGLRLDR